MTDILSLTNYVYSPFTWPPLIVGALIAVVAVLVLIRERVSTVSLAFMSLTLCVALWLIASGFVYASRTPALALTWVKLESLGVVFLPSTLLTFTLVTTDQWRRYRWAAGVCFLLSCFFYGEILTTQRFITGIQVYPWGYYHRYGPRSVPFLILLVIAMSVSLGLLWRTYQKTPFGAAKHRYKLFIQAFGMGYLGAVDFLACFGFHVYPVGYLPVFTFLLLSAQAIWYYRLKDITPALAAAEIVRTMPGLLVVLDLNGTVRIANQAACEFLGKKESDMVGTSITTLIPTPLSRPQIEQFTQEGAVKDFEILVPHAKTGLRTLSVSASIVRDALEHPFAYVCIARDITERQRMERALGESESRFRRLFDSNIIGFMLVDFKGRISEANQALLKMLGYTREDLLNGQLDGSEMTPDEYRFVDEWMLKRIKTLGFCPPVEKEYTSKGGHRIPVLVGVVLLEEAREQCVCFVIDATERRWAMGQLKKAYDELEHRVNERTGDLSKANLNLQNEIDMRQEVEQRLMKTLGDLARSNKELEEFAYIVSHDLQEPLRKVASYTDLLMQRYKDNIGPDADKFIHYIVDGTLRMQQLINDLLAYSRVGRAPQEVDPVYFKDALWEALNNLETSIRESHAEITNDAMPTLPANYAQIVQLFQNLIGNAIKFRRDQPPQIHVAATQNGNEWVFSVADNGIGIDPQYADRIFVVFQRLHTREEYPGTGIGLAICKKVVERHGGRMWVESQVGKGTTFFFSLPVVSTLSTSAEGPPVIALPSKKSEVSP
jgi:PAS domain S-box-containing protein